MARDEADLEAAIRDGGPARVRVYRFLPSCITLGRAQPEDSVDRELAARLGYEVARRPTGGRALLHEAELTYAVVLPPDHGLAAQGIRAAYRELCGALVEALGDLGVGAELARPGEGSGTGASDPGPVGASGSSPGALPRPGPAPCFEEHFVESVLVGGLKVCGSAQARRRGAVLQHGTLRLRVDHDREARLLWPGREPGAAARDLRERMAGLRDGADPAGDPAFAAGLAARLLARLGAKVLAP